MFTKILRTICVLVPIMAQPLFGQTDSLNIFWDKNSEPDMYRYTLQRSVNSLSNFQDFRTLSHPDTHAVDRNVQPGNLYAYRVAAMDSAGNLSNFTAPDSVGIPGINWPASNIVTGQDTFFSNSSFLSDRDGQVNNLQLSVSQENNVSATIQNNGILISPPNPSYIGPASFRLRAEDSDGFYDLKVVQFNFYDPSLIFEFNVPDITFDEDNFFQILMDTTINSSPFNNNEIIWSFDPGTNLDTTYESSTRILTLRSSSPNWFGQDEVIAIATLPDNSSHSDTFTVVIQPVNDAPQSSLQNLYVSPFSNTFNLNLYVTDVDDSLSDLSWESWDYTNFDVQISNNVVQITRLDSTVNSETGFFRVFDPANAADTSQVTILYSSENTPPHLVNFPDTVHIAEDSSKTFNLINFFVDSTHSIEDVVWEFEPGENISYTFHSNNYRLSIIPDVDWFGISSIRIKVSDPLGLSDEKELLINVEARNDIESLSIRQLSPTSVEFTVRSEIPSAITLTYWIAVAERTTIEIATYETLHVITLQNLIPDTTYHFDLTLTDTLGKLVTISDSSFYVGSATARGAGEIIVYPNPCVYQNGHTEVVFDNLPSETKSITVFNILGQKVYERFFQELSNPYYLRAFDGQPLNLASGFYVYLFRGAEDRRIKTGTFVIIR